MDNTPERELNQPEYDEPSALTCDYCEAETDELYELFLGEYICEECFFKYLRDGYDAHELAMKLGLRTKYFPE